VHRHGFEIAGGRSHTCALDATGAVSCWGLDGDGQLGNHAMGSGSAQDALYDTFTSGDTVVQVSAGDITSCAVKRDGSWACWGAGGNGELGNGAVNDSAAPVFDSTEMLVAISAGTSSVCGITPMGEVECWGDNATGVSGSDLSDLEEVIPQPKGISNATLISVGNDHACAALANGDIECWGEAYEGALGTGSAAYSTCPDTLEQCTAQPQQVPPPF
jgi:alpha-tubulin suppressor-like RCC1 family protein